MSDKFMLRLPDGMRDRIKTSAEANNRSMNAEIVHALDRYLGRIDTPPASEDDYVPADDPNYRPLTPEVREALRIMIDQIKGDAERRLNQWLWDPER